MLACLGTGPSVGSAHLEIAVRDPAHVQVLESRRDAEDELGCVLLTLSVVPRQVCRKSKRGERSRETETALHNCSAALHNCSAALHSATELRMALGELLQCNNSVEEFTARCQLKHLPPYRDVDARGLKLDVKR